MTDFQDIAKLLDLMDQHGLEELEVEEEGRRVRLRKRGSAPPVATWDPSQAEPPAPTQPPTPSPQPSEPGDADEGLVFVKSPIVGTFYRSPDPESEPFVEVGVAVTRGQVLCIIEAMKLMNEIDAEENGEIVTIFVENGQPVQYGEKLFAIKPS